MAWLIAHLEVVFGGTLALFAVLLLVQQRRSPQSTAAWLLFVFLLPYVALPAFLLFGIRKPKTARALAPPAGLPVPSPQSDLDSAFRAFGLPPAQVGNRFSLLPSGEDAFSALRTMIERAEQSIDAEFYIVKDDPIGEAFVSMLAERAREGVRVRLLIDFFGGMKRPRKALRELAAAGGEVLFSAPFLGLPGSGRINLRNHRKCVIVDERVAFAGGMNVGCDYMSAGPGTAPAAWTDLSFEIEGPAVEVYRSVLLADMDTALIRNRRSGSSASARTNSEHLPMPGPGQAVLQPVPSGPDIRRDPLHDGIVCAIHGARRRVHIVTPYFLPTDPLAHALHVACLRGIDVRILVPERSNQMLANLARGTYLRNVRDAGGRVFLLRDRMIHAKAGMIDELAWVGSANFDVRSMYLNYEIVSFIYDAGSLETLESWMSGQFSLGQEGLPDVGLPRRIAEGAFRLAAPVL